MANNYEDYGYEENENKSSPIKRVIFIVLLIAFAILLIIFLLKGCSGTNDNNKKPTPPKPAFSYEGTLLQAGKTYFENNMEKYPTSSGACVDVNLQELISKGLVNPDKYSKCNTTSTIVKVCILENGTKHYTPWLNCTDRNSDTLYDVEKEGTNNDIVADVSLIRFEFLPQALKKGNDKLGPVEEKWKNEIKYSSYKTLSTTNYYRYSDKLYTWNVKSNFYYSSVGEVLNSNNVKEYFTSSPNNLYKLSSDKTTGYKWFTTTSKKVYAVLKSNGAKVYLPANEKLNGYPNIAFEEGVCSSYQTRQATGKTYSPYHYYKCKSSDGLIKYQLNVPCGQGIDANKFPIQLEEFYTCGKGEEYEIVSRKTSKTTTCKEYTDWKYSNDTCNTSLETCRKTQPYCVYPRFKLVEDVRKYYPSGSASASGERTYYVSAPIKGAIRDDSTKATVYKWYRSESKLIDEFTAVAPKGYSSATKTNNYKYSQWSEWSTSNPNVNDGRERKIESKQKIKLQEIQGTTESSFEDLSTNYMSENEMIEFFKSKGYKVNSLTDINNNGEIKYKLRMLIRNKKGGN